MSELHLASGSTQPPLTPGLLRLYSMKYCPYAQRTRLVLAHKNVPHDIVNVNLKRKPEWFLEKTPFALVPVIEYEGHIIYESAICNNWVDDVFPEPRLSASTPYERAKDGIIAAHFDKIIGSFFDIYRNSNLEKIKVVDKELGFLEQSLTSDFFGGKQPGLIDFYCWPWIERLPLLKEQGYDPLTSDKHPKLVQWVENMKSIPAVQKTYMEPDVHLQFVKSYLTGQEPKYD